MKRRLLISGASAFLLAASPITASANSYHPDEYGNRTLDNHNHIARDHYIAREEFLERKEGAYFNVSGGMVLPQLGKHTVEGVKQEHIDYRRGYYIGLATGYDWGPSNIRTEVEMAYRDDDHKILNSNPLHRSPESLAFMGNAYYEFRQMPGGHPYIGAGAGIAKIGHDNHVLAYQGMLGVSFDIDENHALYAGYRHFGTTGATIRKEPKTEVAYRMHNIEVGYRFNF